VTNGSNSNPNSDSLGSASILDLIVASEKRCNDKVFAGKKNYLKITIMTGSLHGTV
jgi:hypothetical protein